MFEPLLADDPVVQGAQPARLAALFAARALVPVPVPPADPAAARAEGYAQGFADGSAAACAELAPQRALLGRAVTAFEAARAIDPEALRPLFVALVTQLAEAVVAVELRSSRAAIAALVDATLASVEPAQAVALRLHPDDAGLLGHGAAVPLLPDPAMPRGAVQVEGRDFVIVDGLPERLAAVLATLDRNNAAAVATADPPPPAAAPRRRRSAPR